MDAITCPSLQYRRHSPGPLNGEYVKTKGHYHPENPVCVGYPEVYEVLEGKAHFLLQKKSLDDIVLVEAAMGDIVLIPPGYGHVTINPAPEETLTMANLVSTAFSSEYGFYGEMHGAAYYELAANILEKNPRYPDIPAIRKTDASAFPLTLCKSSKSLYNCIGDDIIARLLNHPEEYPDSFKMK